MGKMRQNRKINWFRMSLFLAVIFSLVAGTVAGITYAWHVYNSNSTSPAGSSASYSSSPLSLQEGTLNKQINILLLGVDDGDAAAQNRRSDTMIVASINPDAGTVNLLSLPRDTEVMIPGRKGTDKITHAYAYGGADLAMRTVESFLHIPIHHHLTLDWQGFISVIDILGGVDLYVEQEMAYRDPYAGLDIRLHKGYQHLDGSKAGQYVRFRHDELGDIGRVQRQQRLVKALTDQMLQVDTIFKLPSLTTTLQQYVQTDMSLFTMLKAANTIQKAKAGAVSTEMLPGDFAIVDGKSYWQPNMEETRRVVERMFLPRQATMSKSGQTS